MCVSLRAGGVGIDLSAGRFVYLLDSWWNKASEDQAIARVQRLGFVALCFLFVHIYLFSFILTLFHFFFFEIFVVVFLV